MQQTRLENESFAGRLPSEGKPSDKHLNGVPLSPHPKSKGQGPCKKQTSHPGCTWFPLTCQSACLCFRVTTAHVLPFKIRVKRGGAKIGTHPFIARNRIQTGIPLQAANLGTYDKPLGEKKRLVSSIKGCVGTGLQEPFYSTPPHSEATECTCDERMGNQPLELWPTKKKESVSRRRRKESCAVWAHEEQELWPTKKCVRLKRIFWFVRGPRAPPASRCRGRRRPPASSYSPPGSQTAGEAEVLPVDRISRCRRCFSCLCLFFCAFAFYFRKENK